MILVGDFKVFFPHKINNMCHVIHGLDIWWNLFATPRKCEQISCSHSSVLGWEILYFGKGHRFEHSHFHKWHSVSRMFEAVCSFHQVECKLTTLWMLFKKSDGQGMRCERHGISWMWNEQMKMLFVSFGWKEKYERNVQICVRISAVLEIVVQNLDSRMSSYFHMCIIVVRLPHKEQENTE